MNNAGRHRVRHDLEAHLAHPREISAVSDPDGAREVRVWLVTDDIGESDTSSRVAFDAAQKAFGLVMKLQRNSLVYGGDPVACIRCAGPLERLRRGTLVRTMPPNENDPGSVYGVEALCG